MAAYDESAVRSATTPPGGPEREDGKRRGLILVVDDERSNLDSLRRILEKAGWEVLTAQNGVEGLDIVRQRAVELVLTDLRMPGMDGVDLLRSVKALAPETEVVLMTAYGTVEMAVQAISSSRPRIGLPRRGI